MIRQHSFVNPAGSQETQYTAPNRSLVNTLESLKRVDQTLEWDFNDATGELRCVTSTKGFVSQSFRNDPRAHVPFGKNVRIIIYFASTAI